MVFMEVFLAILNSEYGVAFQPACSIGIIILSYDLPPVGPW